MAIKHIIINAPRQGVSQSAHVGFSDIRNMDIDSEPGVIKLNTIMDKKSASTVTGQINWFVRNPVTPAEVYALDNGGKVYKSLNNGTTWALMTGFTSGGHGNGLAIFKNYLIVARDAFLDVCGDGSATGIVNANWTNSWQAIDSDLLWHPMLISTNDNKLYGGAGKYVYSLDENTGETFDPGTLATYDWSEQALDLPSPQRIKCIEELGNNLMLGTWQGTTLATENRVGNIYPWDRSSVSFGQPIISSDFGVHAMKNVGNLLVVLTGVSGIISRCDGANLYAIGKIPTDLSGGKYLEWYPGAIVQYKDKIFFGVGNGGTTAIPNQGVYSLLQTGQGNILNLEHEVSTLNDGTLKPLKVSALLPITRDTLLTGWRDDDEYGIDLSSATSYSYGTDYSGSFTSPLYTTGSALNEHKFTSLEFQLSKPLRTGEGIKFEYRNNLTDDFTEIVTYAFADVDVGAVVSKSCVTELPTEIKVSEQIQMRVSLLGTTTTTPNLKNVTIK